jgi:hypothetical protein
MTSPVSTVTPTQLLKRITEKLGKEIIYSDLRDGSINLRKAEA